MTVDNRSLKFLDVDYVRERRDGVVTVADNDGLFKRLLVCL